VNITTGLCTGGAATALLATAKLPYGYYTFARVALAAVVIALAVLLARNGKGGWLFGLVPIGALWNPILPVYLTRAEWFPLDLLAAAFFIVLLVVESRSGKVDACSKK
jgi:hypothetical protein